MKIIIPNDVTLEIQHNTTDYPPDELKGKLREGGFEDVSYQTSGEILVHLADRYALLIASHRVPTRTVEFQLPAFVSLSPELRQKLTEHALKSKQVPNGHIEDLENGLKYVVWSGNRKEFVLEWGGGNLSIFIEIIETMKLGPWHPFREELLKVNSECSLQENSL